MKHMSNKEKVLTYEIDELYSKMSVINQEFYKQNEFVQSLFEKHMKWCKKKEHNVIKCSNFEEIQQGLKKFYALEDQKLSLSFRNVELQRERIEEMRAQQRPKEIIEDFERITNELEALLELRKEKKNEFISQ